MKEGEGQENDKRALEEYRGGESSLSTYFQRDYRYEDTRLEDELNLKDYLDILLRRKWIVVSCLLITVVTTTVASLVMTKIYRAEAIIEIAPENPKITAFEEVVEVEAKQDEFYETQYRLIKSKTLAKRVVEALGLEKHPEFAPEDEKPGFLALARTTFAELFSLDGDGKVDPSERIREEQAREENLVSAFLDRVSVSPERKSRLVRVSFESSDPELSARAVNTLIDKYIEWVLERKIEATKSAREFLERQLREVKAKLERAEEELSAFAKGADIVSLDEKLNLTLKQLAELNEALSKAETERLSKEALYREVKQGNYEYLPQVIGDPSIQALREEYTRLRSQYDNLSVIYGPNYPDVKQIGAQIQRVEKEIGRRVNGIVESIRKDYQAALTKEKLLRQRAEEQKRLVTELNDKAIQYRILEREVETNKSIYQSLLQRLKETEVTSGIKVTNIQVVDYASVPFFPYRPNIKLNVLLALVLGLAAGCSLAFVLEHFDNTIKDEEDIKRRFSFLPFLGVVPLAAEGETEIEKISYKNPKSLISEAFRVIRTSLLYSSAEHPPRSILVTSSQPLEGKTTSASNLALSIIQSGLKVALVDADLRKPRLHKVFLNGNTPFGLSSYLVGRIELQGIIYHTEINGLDLIPAGPIPPNPAELLGSNRMKELVERLLEEYDHVIIDGPPVMGIADSRLLCRIVDGVLLVTSLGITQRSALRSCVEELLRVRGKIVGTIVNRFESKKGKYGYNYYYYYGGEEHKERKRLRPRSNNRS
ncbi:MAG: chain-length determining protein [Deltaproteobacteria bacterium]|mgnify:FL=1|nr:MAG: chain-length determining protein [Deltaproteobacteria bacterium]